MPAAGALPGAGGDDAVEIAIERHRVLALADLPAQPLGDVQLIEEQQRALRRRPPFQRRDVCEGIETAPVGGEHRRQREIVDDAGQTRRLVERALRIGQGEIGRHQFLDPHPAKARQTANAPRHQRPGEAERQTFGAIPQALAKKRGAAVAGGRRARGKRDVIDVVGQNARPQTCGNDETLGLCLSRRG